MRKTVQLSAVAMAIPTSGDWWHRGRPAAVTGALSLGGMDMPNYLRRPTGGSRPRVLALPLLALLAPALIVGCGATPSHTADKIVVAASASANEPEPVLAAADQSLLYAAGNHSTNAVAYVVNTNTGQSARVELTPLRPDGQVQYGPGRSGQIAQNVGQVERLLGRQAATGSFDLLTLITAAARVTSPPATLLIMSSGLSTAGGFDLRQVGWAADPAAVATELKQKGLLPNLAGWRIVFSGLGDTAGPQHPLPLPQQTTLTAYWMAICRAAGAASCATDNTTRPDPAPRSITPVPVVPVPTVLSVTGPHGATGISVPTEEFFAFGSSQLLPGADAILSPIAARARAGHLLVSITGYASPDGGTAAYNEALSQRRAQAVQARLLDLGVLPGQIAQVTGAGTAGASCYQEGQLDETACAALRRVVILLSPQQTIS
jgi:outer membrane protein OmpA-like peptidoglycan-associated protein